MTVPVQQLHNVLRTYEKAFKPVLQTPSVVQPSSFHAADRTSISQDALTKLGDTALR